MRAFFIYYLYLKKFIQAFPLMSGTKIPINHCYLLFYKHQSITLGKGGKWGKIIIIQIYNYILGKNRAIEILPWIINSVRQLGKN